MATKKELLEKISAKTDLTQKKVDEVFKMIFEEALVSLKKEKKFSVPSFGTFKISVRKARTGRNPQTGETIKIPKSKSVSFKASKSLKEKL